MEKIVLLSAYFLLVLAMGGAIILLHWLFSTKNVRKFPEKYEPFESGMKPFHSARIRFPYKFYTIAMMFLVFDIEVALLLPYVVVSRELGVFGVFEVLFFFIVLAVAYLFLRWTAFGQLREK